MGLKFLLDTNILSDPLKRTPDVAIAAHLKEHAEEIATCSLVWHELVYGATRIPDGRRKERISAYLDGLIMLPVLEYDRAAAQWHAAERSQLEANGIGTPFIDGQIAAIAVVNDLTLVTRNVKHFKPFSKLKLAQWEKRPRAKG